MAIKAIVFTKNKNNVSGLATTLSTPIHIQEVSIDEKKYTFAYTRTDLGVADAPNVEFWAFMSALMFKDRERYQTAYEFKLTNENITTIPINETGNVIDLTTARLESFLASDLIELPPCFKNGNVKLTQLIESLITISKQDDKAQNIGPDGASLTSSTPPAEPPPPAAPPAPPPPAAPPAPPPTTPTATGRPTTPWTTRAAAPPVPPEKALSLPVDGIAMIAGYSKGETAPFALQNVYIKKDGGFGINNDAVVTLKKRYKLIGQPGDIFTLECTPSNFILIPVVFKKTLKEASHWTSAFVQRPGAKTDKSKFAYVAVKNVEWKFEENWIQYGVPEAPRVLLIYYEEAPEGLAYPDDVDLITANQANRECETISPFDAVATGFMNYLVSSNRDRNPTGIPLYRTQNLNVYMNRFSPP